MEEKRSTLVCHANIKLWQSVILIILILSILRGIRFPNMWSYTHFLFNYEFGFVKRGLIGELIRQTGIPYLRSYEAFNLFSLFVLAINIVLLSLALKKLVEKTNAMFVGFALVFVSSLAVGFISHLVGYFDQVGLLIVLITLRMERFYHKVLFLVPAMTFVLLAHEAVFVIVSPILFMSLLLSIEPNSGVKKGVTLGVIAALSFLLLLFVSFSTLERSEVHEMHKTLQAQNEHPLRSGAFAVLHRKPEDNREIMQKIWSDMSRLGALANSLLVTIPVFSLFICFTVVYLKSAQKSLAIQALAVLASLSPLVLHGFGWDMNRWNTLTIVTSFFMLYMACSLRPTAVAMNRRSYFYPLFALLVFLNGASSVRLFDGYYVKSLPFIEHQDYVTDLISGKAVFPHVPQR